MKKYVKPALFYEKFELSQHIADCAWELNSTNKESCHASADPKFLDDSPNLFVSALSTCVYNEDNYQNYCYHDGVQGVNVFAS